MVHATRGFSIACRRLSREDQDQEDEGREDGNGWEPRGEGRQV